MLRRTLFALSLLTLFSSQACSQGDEDSSSQGTVTPDHAHKTARSELQRDPAPQVSDEAKSALVQGHNAFAFDMYDLIRQEEGANENMFFSPTSMTLALSMVYAGARGTSATEMATALHFTLPAEQLFPAFNWLDQALGQRADKAYQDAQSDWENGKRGDPPSADSFRLHIVNSIWGEQTMTFESPFLDTLAVHYGAGVYLSDFIHKPNDERLRINDWVASETRDLIKDLLPEATITDETRTGLVNAIHLKFPWQEKFSPSEDVNFSLLDGSLAAVPAIEHSDTWPYYEKDGLQAVRVALEGSEIELVVMAPPKGQLGSFETGLTQESLATLFEGMESQAVTLQIPILRFTTPSISLRSKLETLGMPSPFDPSRADFSAITKDESLYLSDVIHKAMIGIDKNGIEAAAATAAIANELSSVADPVPFTVDRPFFLALVDAPTKTILFTGHIVDPRP